MSSFKQKLSCLMRNNGLSQAKTAVLVGVSQRTVSDWLSEGSYPRPDKIKKISEVFRINPEVLTDDSRELTSLTFKEHCDTLRDAGEAARNLFPNNEANAARIADALIGAGYAMKAIPRLEDRLEKLETGMAETVKFIKGLRNNYEAKNPKHNLLKTNDSKVATEAILKNETRMNPLEKRLNKIECEIDQIRAAMEKLIGRTEDEKRPVTLEEIAEARKMAEGFSTNITARKRKKKAE